MTPPSTPGPRARTLPLAPLAVLIALGALWASRREASEGAVRADPVSGEAATPPPGAEDISLPPPETDALGPRRPTDPEAPSQAQSSQAEELAALRVRVVDEFGAAWEDLRVDVGSHRHMTISVGDDGKPIADFEEFLAQTDSDGVVVFEGLKPKTARIQVDDPDGKPWFEEVELLPARTTEHEFVIVRTKAITGRVVDSRGEPLASSPVGLFKKLSSYDLGQGIRHNRMFTDPRSSSTNQESGMLTDVEGRFALRAPTEPGAHPYMLGAKHEGLLFSGIELPRPDPIGLYPPIELVLEDPVILRGSVRYADGSPGSGIDCIPLGGRAATQIIAWLGDSAVDAEGRFEIRTRPEVTHLSYGGPGGHSIQVSVGEVVPGDVLEFDLTWTPPEGTAILWFHDTLGEILEEQSPHLENVELVADWGAGAPPSSWLVDSAPEVIEIPTGSQARVVARRAGSEISSRVLVKEGDIAHMTLDDDPVSMERTLTLNIEPPEGVPAKVLAEAIWGVRVQLGGLEGPIKSGLRDPNSRGTEIRIPLERWPAGPLDIAWVGMTGRESPYSVLGRETLRIPDVGDPAPLTVDVLPCFHIDLTTCPRSFFYSNPPGALELLDPRGQTLWRYRLGMEFSHGQLANFPLVDHGTAQLRRGEDVHQLDERVRTE